MENIAILILAIIVFGIIEFIIRRPKLEKEYFYNDITIYLIYHTYDEFGDPTVIIRKKLFTIKK